MRRGEEYDELQSCISIRDEHLLTGQSSDQRTAAVRCDRPSTEGQIRGRQTGWNRVRRTSTTDSRGPRTRTRPTAGRTRRLSRRSTSRFIVPFPWLICRTQWRLEGLLLVIAPSRQPHPYFVHGPSCCASRLVADFLFVFAFLNRVVAADTEVFL